MHQTLLSYKIGIQFLQEVRQVTSIGDYTLTPLKQNGNSGYINKKNQSKNEQEQKEKPILGYMTDTHVYLKPDQTYEVVSQRIDIGSKKNLSTDLKLEGIIQTDRLGSATSRIRINGEREGFYKIRKQVWETIG